MWEIIGYKHVCYKRKDGSNVDGYELHLAGGEPDDDFEGQLTYKVFCSPPRPPQLGDVVTLRISFFGGEPKVNGINYIK